jgi:hypothetical protein
MYFCLSLPFVKKIRNGFSDRKEVAKAINAEKYGVLGTFSGWLLMKALKYLSLNFYDGNKHLKT